MTISAPIHKLGVALLRIGVGIIFLWAGLEKVLGSGPDGFNAAGFLAHATGGSLGWPFVTGSVADGTIFNPTHEFWVSLSQNAGAMSVINFLVVFGEVAIGLCLILGLATRFAAAMGTLMMLFFFVAAWEFSNGIVNQHLTYALICAAIAGLGAGKYYGLDAVISERFPAAVRRYLLSGDVPGAGAPEAGAPAGVPATA
jgi:thiosulfate dehydrogenase [quinone] large subunit